MLAPGARLGPYEVTGSLGVPAASIKSVARGEYRRLIEVARAYAGTSAIVITTAVGGEALAPDAAPRWKVVFVN